jgi:hypothetical protein
MLRRGREVIIGAAGHPVRCDVRFWCRPTRQAIDAEGHHE